MEPNDSIRKIAGGEGCDIVSGTSEFIGRNGKLIYAIISNEDDSRLISMKKQDGTSVVGLSYLSVKRIDTITLTGTSGTATIICGGVTETCTWNAGGLTLTASTFVTAQAAAYLAAGIVLTSSGANLIFTSLVSGTDFTGSTSGANASGDLVGTVVHTVANVLFAINDNKLIIPDCPMHSITLGKGTVYVYYSNN